MVSSYMFFRLYFSFIYNIKCHMVAAVSFYFARNNHVATCVFGRLVNLEPMRLVIPV